MPIYSMGNPTSTFSAMPSTSDAPYNVPSYSSSTSTGSTGGFGNMTDILSLINSLKQKNAAQAFGFQSSLLGQQLGEQGREANLVHDLGNTRAANDLKLGTGELDLKRFLGQGGFDLQGRQLGESGRQFDVGTQFSREQEANKYKYLADLLNWNKEQAERARVQHLMDNMHPGADWLRQGTRNTTNQPWIFDGTPGGRAYGVGDYGFK